MALITVFGVLVFILIVLSLVLLVRWFAKAASVRRGTAPRPSLDAYLDQGQDGPTTRDVIETNIINKPN